jgi:hypothetical protein
MNLFVQSFAYNFVCGGDLQQSIKVSYCCSIKKNTNITATCHDRKGLKPEKSTVGKILSKILAEK